MEEGGWKLGVFNCCGDASSTNQSDQPTNSINQSIFKTADDLDQVIFPRKFPGNSQEF